MGEYTKYCERTNQWECRLTDRPTERTNEWHMYRTDRPTHTRHSNENRLPLVTKKVKGEEQDVTDVSNIKTACSRFFSRNQAGIEGKGLLAILD